MSDSDLFKWTKVSKLSLDFWSRMFTSSKVRVSKSNINLPKHADKLHLKVVRMDLSTKWMIPHLLSTKEATVNQTKSPDSLPMTSPTSQQWSQRQFQCQLKREIQHKRVIKQPESVVIPQLVTRKTKKTQVSKATRTFLKERKTWLNIRLCW